MKVDTFVLWMIGMASTSIPYMLGHHVFQWQWWAIAAPINAVLVVIYLTLRSKEKERLRNTNH
jgi:bacteriorhodopsin